MGADCTKCKCWIKPWEPPNGCYDCCVGRILKYAKPHELVKYFHLDDALAEKIYEITADEKKNTLTKFQPHLTTDEYQTINFQFKAIDSEAWTWIATTLKLRMEIEQTVFA
jgi:hypothetical protein